MISFKSRCEAIRKADRITRKVNSIYPHISESRNRINIKHFQEKYYPLPICYKLSNLNLKNSNKLDSLRYRNGEGIDSFRNIIDMLKNNKIGNCYEESILAQIIGKINGIENIYPSKIFFNRNSSGHQVQLDHVVAIITDKPFNKGSYYNFKNKDAIVVDPWLNITDYVGDYICKLRTNFVNIFPNIPDMKYTINNLPKITKNIKEFNIERKKIFKPDFSFKLHTDDLLSSEDTITLRKEYPELIIKNR